MQVPALIIPNIINGPTNTLVHHYVLPLHESSAIAVPWGWLSVGVSVLIVVILMAKSYHHHHQQDVKNRDQEIK